jgi:hypothetical protein
MERIPLLRSVVFAAILVVAFTAPAALAQYDSREWIAPGPWIDAPTETGAAAPRFVSLPSTFELSDIQPAAFQYGAAGPNGGRPTRLADQCACGGECGYESVCSLGCPCGVCSEKCPTHTLIGLVGYEMFRGHPDGGWGNWGINSGFNFGTRLGRFSDWTGVGFQIGGTMGVYDWSGTDYRLQNQDQAETQGFITYGLFRNPTQGSPWNAAVVHDWMINDTFGVFGEDPTLQQWRGQVGYIVNDYYEIGVWGAWRAHGDTRDVPVFGRTTWRPVNQLNIYWKRRWNFAQADTWIWAGAPDDDRLTGGGSLGSYLIGLRAEVPLSERWRIYSLTTYMHPSASPGPLAAQEEAWSWLIGMSFYTGKSAVSKNIAGRRWQPQLPVASNGYFLVDASQIY